uniref:endoplasmic reticulum junction formation protein lunapark n=1 Tax=Myxine glutinosa TaxID=7769 RepID=UPI00358F07AB
MGAVLSSWRLIRVKPSTVEILEGIEQEIALLEEKRERAERQQRLWIGRLVFYSALFYCCAAALFWFWYFPDLWLDRLLFILPFIIFPILIHMMKNFLSWWFVKSTEKNALALEEQTDKKKRILEEVKDKQTYKNAKEILEKFDPELKKAKQQEQQQLAAPQVQTSQELRQRTVAQRGLPSSPASPPTAEAQVTNARGVIVSASPPGLIVAPGGPPERLLMTSPHGPIPGRRFVPIDFGAPCAPGMHPPGPPLPRPILPRQRGMADRIIEYLVGDGPQNRYALICHQCCSHNGMALREEFEYIAFRCAYCFSMNPARKAKPQPPRLTELAGPRNLPANLASLLPGSSLAAPISVDEATVDEDADVVPVDASPAGLASKTSPTESSNLELSRPTREEEQEESHEDADEGLKEVFEAVLESNEPQESKMAADAEFANAVEAMETEC